MARRTPASLLIPALSALLSAATPAAAAPRVPTHVACVGDSITYGYAASSPAKSYPSVLQALFGTQVKVGNFGHNAATLLSAPYGDLPYVKQSEFQGASSFVSGAGASAIVDVVILLGANDSKPANWAPANQPKNDQHYLEDYRALVDHFTGLTPKPLVYLALPLATGKNPCCMIDGTVIAQEMIPLIKQVAQEKQLPIIDLNTPTTGHPEYFGDGVHPTDAGYAIVAGLVRDGLLAEPASNGGAGGAAGGSAGASHSAGGASGASFGGASFGGASGAANAGTSGSAGGTGVAGASTSGVSGGSPSAGASALGLAGASSSGAAAAGSVANPATQAPPGDGGCSLSAKSDGSAYFIVAGVLALRLAGARRRRVRDVLHAPARP